MSAKRTNSATSSALIMGDFRFASELVEFIRETQDGHFRIEVGCYPETHPQAEDALADLRNFKAKVDAGADSAITQYFYNADAYFRFVDDVRRLGISIPIIPGIMPGRFRSRTIASKLLTTARCRPVTPSAA